VAACNIGAAEKRVRMIMGTVSFIVGVAAAAVLVYTGVSRWWRLLLVLPFYNAALGLFQAGYGTCVMMAGQGYRKMQARLERVTDPEEDRALRRQARKIFILSALLAAATTALCVLFPLQPID
jgi:fatty acid desaturase